MKIMNGMRKMREETKHISGPGKGHGLPTLSLGVCLLLLAGAGRLFGLTAPELRALQAGGEKMTIIDVRSTELFSQGHIPGAINIPAALCGPKKLPPLGRVVVYDQGLGHDQLDLAVEELNKKPGIQAERLEGGLAAWEAHLAPTTRPSGMALETLPIITFDQLKAVSGADTVLVDLRQEAAQERQDVATAGVAPPRSLSDLGRLFPNISRVVRSPFDLPQTRQETGKSAAPRPLMVLIDNGTGLEAQKMLRALKANGVTRVVILAGGEQILARDGRPGLQRTGVGGNFEFTPPTGETK